MSSNAFHVGFDEGEAVLSVTGTAKNCEQSDTPGWGLSVAFCTRTAAMFAPAEDPPMATLLKSTGRDDAAPAVAQRNASHES